MDAPIYLELAAGGSIVGPVGFLRKGARVDAVLRSDLPDHIEVDTTFPQPLSWIISEADVAKAQGRVLARLGLSVLVPKQSVPRNWSRLGSADSLVWGYYRPLHLRPGGAQFSLLLCGRVRELDQRNGYVFVAAEFPTGELWGWMNTRPHYPDTPSHGDDFSCMHPIPEGKPEDYRYPTKEFEQMPLEKRMLVGDEFFYVRRSDSTSTKLECQRARLDKPTKAAGLVLQYLRMDGGIEKTRSISPHDDRVYIDKSQLNPDGSLILELGGVGTHLRAVIEDGSSIGFVEFGSSVDEYDSRVSYFHPTAVWWWDRTPERCQERLELLRDATAPYE